MIKLLGKESNFWANWLDDSKSIVSLFRLSLRTSVLFKQYIFSDWVDPCSMKFLSDCYLLSHVTGVSALIQRSWWDDQPRYFLVLVSYAYTISTRSRRCWSICLTDTRNCSCFVFLLNFDLDYLTFLVKDGSDKPSIRWCSLYVVWKTWEKLNYV